MVVVVEGESATFGDDVESVATLRPYFARLDEGAEEGIVGVIHLIAAEHGFKATFVECLIVGYEG